jgi:hypothetical protein
MRIQYTLPQMHLPDVDAEFIEADAGSFRSRLRRLAPTPPRNWKHILRLDQTNDTATDIGTPPRPMSLEIKDVASERLRWRHFLTQQALVSDGHKDIQRMLALLQAYQSMEDEVVSRYLTDARG